MKEADKEEEKRAVQGIEGARGATEIPWSKLAPEGDRSGNEEGGLPDPEVPSRPVRRRFTVEDKLRILKLADACVERGSLGALLRREGLYASTLATWRRQRTQGVLKALTPRKRGREGSKRTPLMVENEKLCRKNEQLTERLRQAEIIIDVQKKISQMLGIPPSPQKKREDD